MELLTEGLRSTAETTQHGMELVTSVVDRVRVSTRFQEPPCSRQSIDLKDVVEEWNRENRFRSTALQVVKVKLKKPVKVQKVVQSCTEFQVFLIVTLLEVEEGRTSLVHFFHDDQQVSQDSHIPSLIVTSGIISARMTYRQDDVELEGPNAPLVKGVPTQIRFQFVGGKMSLQVGDKCTHKIVAGFAIEAGKRIAISLGGCKNDQEKPANATVSHLFFYAHVSVSGNSADAEVSFPMPQAEKELMARSKIEMDRNKEWAKFDGFFGFWLVLNSACLGIQIEAPDAISWWPVVESTFLVVFIIEWFLRMYWARQAGGCKALLQDYWFHFDGLVIFISIMDAWVVADLPGFFSALRLIRLLKLAKMVRLVRAFKELAMLMEGFIMSMRTLFWAFNLVVLILYFFAILIVQTARWGGNATHESLKPYFNVWHTMWTLGQMATLDNWGALVRQAFFQAGGVQGSLIGIFMCLCIIVTALGTFNVVIGIICHTSFKIATGQGKLSSAELLLRQQDALKTFRSKLKEWGNRPLFKDDKFIECDELFDALAKDSEVKHAADVLQLHSADFIALCEAFREKGSVEIQALCEAIGIIELQAYYAKSRDDVIASSEANSGVRPPDFMYFHFSFQEADKHLRRIESCTKSLCANAYTVLGNLYDRAQGVQTQLRMTSKSVWTPSQQTPQPPPELLSVKSLSGVTSTFSVAAAHSRSLMPVDVACGILVTLNSVLNGAQVMNQKTNGAVEDFGFFTVCDAILAVCFVIEFCWRAVVHANLDFVTAATKDNQIMLRDAAEVTRARYHWYKEAQRFRFIPPLPPGASRKLIIEGFNDDRILCNGHFVFAGFFDQCPYYKRSGSAEIYLYCLECSTWVIGHKVGEPLPPAGEASHTRSSTILTNLIYDTPCILLPPLGSRADWDGESEEVMLRAPRIESIKLIFRTIWNMLRDIPSMLDLALIVFCFIDSLVLEVIRRVVGTQIHIVAVSSLRVIRVVRLVMALRVLQLFPSLQSLFYALVNVWRTILWTVLLICLILYSYAICMVVMTRSGDADPELEAFFGSMTLAAETGWGVASFDHWEEALFTVVQKAPYAIVPTLALCVLTSLGLMKMAVGVMCESAISLTRNRLREQRNAEVIIFIKRMNELRDMFVERLGSAEVPQEIMEVALNIRMRKRSRQSDYEPSMKVLQEGMRPSFVKDLRKRLIDAKLHADLVRKIFDKMDTERRGVITVDQLARGGIILREANLYKISLYASSLAVMKTRKMCDSLHTKLLEFRTKLEVVLEDAHALLLQSGREARAAAGSRATKKTAVDRRGVDKSAERRLQELSDLDMSIGLLALPDIRETGTLKTNRGSGQIDVYSNEIQGTNTDFRKEVGPGDLIVWDHIAQAKTGDVTKTALAAVVVAVNDAHTLRIQPISVPQGCTKLAYAIVKHRPTPLGPTVQLRKEMSVKIAAPKQMDSPRTSALTYDWHIETQMRQADRAWRERSNLWAEYFGYEDMLKQVKELDLCRQVLLAWSAAEKTGKLAERSMASVFGGLKSWTHSS